VNIGRIILNRNKNQKVEPREEKGKRKIYQYRHKFLYVPAEGKIAPMEVYFKKKRNIAHKKSIDVNYKDQLWK